MDGQRAVSAGDHALAVQLLERAAAIQRTPSLRALLAQEQAALGRLTAAFANAEQCNREADQDPLPSVRRELAARCQALVTQLQQRLGRVTVVVEGAPAELVVTLNDARVPPALLGAPYAVDPGSVRVAVSAAGFEPFARSVQLAEGATVEVRASLTPVRAAAPEPRPEPRPEPPREVPPPPPPARPVAPWVIVGVGSAAVVAGVGTILGRLGWDAQVEAVCPSRTCPSEAVRVAAQPYTDMSLRLTVAGGITLGLGVAGVLGGVGWYLTAPRSPGPSAVLLPTPNGAVLLGRF